MTGAEWIVDRFSNRLAYVSTI